jgi:hypothetical protein
MESDELVRSLGYRSIVLTKQGLIQRGTSPFHLPRLSISEMPVDEFRWKLETAFAGMKT